MVPPRAARPETHLDAHAVREDRNEIEQNCPRREVVTDPPLGAPVAEEFAWENDPASGEFEMMDVMGECVRCCGKLNMHIHSQRSNDRRTRRRR